MGDGTEITTLREEIAALRAELDAMRRELKVERIDIVESDGTLRLCIANDARIHGGTIQGEKIREDGGRGAGLIFFNDDGDECGGLVFGSEKADGRRSTFEHMSFDRRNQDQVFWFNYQEVAGEGWTAGLRIADRPDEGLVSRIRRYDAANSAPEPERQALLSELAAGEGSERLWLGRKPDGGIGLELCDARGRVRARLAVAAEGGASLAFFDEDGRETRTIGP